MVARKHKFVFAQAIWLLPTTLVHEKH